MKIKKISLAKQIKKAIGNRILFCSIIFMITIFALTIYDLSISIKQLRLRINEQVKPIEDFAINQAIINNLDTVKLKIDSFNESNQSFQIEWIRHGKPIYKTITWRFPFTWVYDYGIGEIAGFQFGYFKVYGGFLSDKALIYDLLFRLTLLAIFIISVLSILYPLAKKIPEQLFLNPINRFIDLVSNNSIKNEITIKKLPVELEVLETKILSLLTTAKEHERNKAIIELGHLSARLAHDIHSPLAAMEMGLDILTKKLPKNDLTILINGIQSIRDIANNVIKRYRKPNVNMTSFDLIEMHDDGNIVRPVLLFNLVEMMVSQKRYEWHHQLCELVLMINSNAKISWINVAPNEVKRLLSNLLNNAYDALSKKIQGRIYLTLDVVKDKLQLQLEDNGIGIPSEKISDVLNGISLKHNGNGLGLSEARKYMENLGGHLDIRSNVGEGTKINLIFPLINKLSWFPFKISLHNMTTIIVLDDDLSTLMYWGQRISDIGLVPKLFSEYGKALEWLEDNENIADKTVFLADYKLENNETSNGLMFLEKINNNNNRYLITSHAEELFFQNAAAEKSIWLIPKSLMNEIAFNLE